MGIKFPKYVVLNSSPNRQIRRQKKSMFKGMSEWQKKAFKLRNETYLIIKAPSGSGKSHLVVWLSMDELYESNRKVVIMVPQKQIAETFSKENNCEGVCVRMGKRDVIWRVGLNLCGGWRPRKLNCLKKFLLEPASNMFRDGVFNGSSCVVTHAAMVGLWEKLSDEERLEVSRNTTFYLDEGHHACARSLSKEEEKYATRIGMIMEDILLMNEKHPGLGSRLRYVTATFFRSDGKHIVSKKHRKKFKTYNHEFIDHYRSLHIEQFSFEFVLYKKDPLKHVARMVAEDPTAHHLYINPSEGDTYNKDRKALSKLKRLLKKVIPPEVVADLVSRGRRRREIVRKLFENPALYHLVMACKLFDEGTNWAPCNRIHTPIIKAMTRLVQVVGRSFREWHDKKDIKVYVYVKDVPGSRREKMREMFSDYFNGHQATFLMDLDFNPIKLPLIDSSMKVSLREVFGDSFLDVYKEVVEGFDSMTPQQKANAGVVRRMIDRVIHRHRSCIPVEVDRKEIAIGLQTMLMRATHIAENQETVTDINKQDMINAAFIRKEGFDKIWSKSPFRGSLIFGTEEPLTPEEFRQLRQILRIRRYGHDAEVLEEVDKAERRATLRELPVTKVQVTQADESPENLEGHWAKFRLTTGSGFGIIVDASNDTYRVRYYKNAERKDGEIFCRLNGHTYVHRGDYWKPIWMQDDYCNATKKLRKRFLKNEQLYEEIDIPKKSVIFTDS